METLGQRLEAVRRRKVMTQAELAHDAGVSLITVTRLENDSGGGNPRPLTVRRIAETLGVDPAWLLFGDASDAGRS
jgi:transcriptional regulator with XRE-family HTH domain